MADGAFLYIGADLIIAIHFRKGIALGFHRHHAAAVNAPAIAGIKSFSFHQTSSKIHIPMGARRSQLGATERRLRP